VVGVVGSGALGLLGSRLGASGSVPGVGLGSVVGSGLGVSGVLGSGLEVSGAVLGSALEFCGVLVPADGTSGSGFGCDGVLSDIGCSFQAAQPAFTGNLSILFAHTESAPLVG
jgi:hypothetical protein